MAASIESFYANAEYIDAEPAPAESTESAPADAASQSDRITPHTSAAESLNAGIAASVTLYEIAKLRGATRR